ncbi:MAG: hypothetical protein KKI08_28255 [Armatimonadetes bacterium]|nr:hypothetical protein [Armatimonadota bacterium]
MSSGDTFLKNHKCGIVGASGIYAYTDVSGNMSGTVIDTQGWSGVVFLVNMNAKATASCYINVQGAATSASCAAGSSVDLSGTKMSVSATTSGQQFQLEVHKPAQRYVRLYATRNVSATFISGVYILYGPTGFASNAVPLNASSAAAIGITDASSGMITVEQHVSPAVGTA